jgi:hypothetical protein
MCKQSWLAIVIILGAAVFLSIFLVWWASIVLPIVLLITLIWFAALRGPDENMP